ncbi:NAD(P)-dependent oxidoreductase [Mycobacterium sp. pUA109]|uniref:NAD(P)-dependent oxidoreductase n=1 Tax=Mycobacterium sp. pUA109 TaxID=3238982 RepID=UPI00351B482E
MHVLLLGATGKVGAPIREELRQRGHEVTAVARDGSSLPAADAALHHRIGDLFNSSFLKDAAQGTQVVLCSVALRDAAQRNRTPLTLMHTAACAALGEGARLVALGGAGSLRGAAGIDLVDTPNFPEAAKRESLGFRAALRDLIDVAPAELEWTVVSPPASIEFDRPRTANYRTADDDLIVDAAGVSHISAADLAVAVVDEVENPKHPRRRFTVGY